jgi:hypothetical protein
LGSIADKRALHLLCKKGMQPLDLKRFKSLSVHFRWIKQVKKRHDHKIKAQFIEDPLLRDSGRPNLGSFLDPVE